MNCCDYICLFIDRRGRRGRRGQIPAPSAAPNETTHNFGNPLFSQCIKSVWMVSAGLSVTREMAMVEKVLVSGGAGYVGCVLVPKLLDAGYQVRVYDLMLYGDDGLPSHDSLEVIKGDIRDIESFSSAMQGMDAIIHLACISNDPSFEPVSYKHLRDHET